jgi:hypothetical protein
MGHLKVLHFCTSFPVEQALPPKAVATTTDLVLVFTPPLQVLVHEVQMLHLLRAQSMAQACLLQVRCSLAGHSSPPCAAATLTEWSRVCVPAPQLLVQVDQAFHVIWQSMGQECELQFRLLAMVAHALPPWAAVETMERVLVCTPLPHSSEHVVQVLYLETMQSIGHSKMLQRAISFGSGQSLPP